WFDRFSRGYPPSAAAVRAPVDSSCDSGSTVASRSAAVIHPQLPPSEPQWTAVASPVRSSQKWFAAVGERSGSLLWESVRRSAQGYSRPRWISAVGERTKAWRGLWARELVPAKGGGYSTGCSLVSAS
ncbi:bifunctional enzyme IspD/IspF, partial [Striga asiatica]